MSMYSSSHLGKLRTAIIICCLILILGIFGYAYLIDGDNKVLPKDEIENNISELSDKDYGYTYVSSYAKKYGVGNLNSYKFNTIESMLESGFYKQLPDEKTLAKDSVLLFMEYYYDRIDLNDKEAVTDALLNCMIASIGDPYAYYRTKEEFEQFESDLAGGEEFVGIGVLIQQNLETGTLEVITVYPGSGAEEAGIKPYDLIHAVNGKTGEEVTPDEMTEIMRGEENTSVEVTVKRGDELLTFTVTRKKIVASSVTYRMDQDNVGYIQISQFLQDTPYAFKTAVDFCVQNGAVALVIDVRNNPGGLLYAVEEVIDYLVPDAEGRRIDSYTQNSGETVCYTTDGHGVDLPIAVLCDGGTASAGELFTAAMRDYGDAGILDTVIVGTNTFGKGIVQSSYPLYDGSAITFTIGYFNPPSDVNFNGVGIAPDIEMTRTLGHDETFDLAKTEVLKMANTNDGAPVYYDAAA